MATDASTVLSKYFKLGDLTVTNQALTQPNMPSSQEEMNNLWTLARYLDQVMDLVGAFSILSGYRTEELENVLTAQGEPTSPTKSFHEVGRGVDITPTTMNINDMFGRILANSDLLNALSEISIKPSQNSIHLAVNVPGDDRIPKVLMLDPSGKYARMSDEDIANYIAPYVVVPEDDPNALIEVASSINAGGPGPLIKIAAVAAILFWAFSKKEKSALRET